jgi:hypothetical protein
MLEIGGVDAIAEQERSHAPPFGSLRLAAHRRDDGTQFQH